MKFKINNMEWEILEVKQEAIIEEMKKHNDKPWETGKYFGITYFDDQRIFLDKDLCKDRKRHTLMHELAHCYIGTFMSHVEKEYTEEDVCDMVANSFDIINDIVNKYLSKKEK